MTTTANGLTAEENAMLAALLEKKQAAAQARLEAAQESVGARLADIRAIVASEAYTSLQTALEEASATLPPALQTAIGHVLTCAAALPVAIDQTERTELAKATAVVDEAFPPAPAA